MNPIVIILSIILAVFTLGSVIKDVSENEGDTAVIANFEAIGSCVAAVICIFMAFKGILTGVNIPLAIVITIVFAAIIAVTYLFTDYEEEGLAVIASAAINMIAISICLFAV